LGLITTRNF